jgi:hypothetical protein
MLIYRLEHRSSGLGPFEHKSSRQKTPPQDACAAIRSWTKDHNGVVVMADLSELPEVKAILRENPKAVFGWTNEQAYWDFIIDEDLLYRLGFRKRTYVVDPLYVSACHQAIFLKPSTHQ